MLRVEITTVAPCPSGAKNLTRSGLTNTFAAAGSGELKHKKIASLKNEWVEMGDPAPPRRRTHGGAGAGALVLVKPLPPKAVAGRPGFTRTKRPRLQSPPAYRWAAIQDHALAPSPSRALHHPIRNSKEPENLVCSFSPVFYILCFSRPGAYVMSAPAVDNQELWLAQPTLDDVVEGGAPSLAGLAAHVLDSQQPPSGRPPVRRARPAARSTWPFGRA
jgi:hypothetical protein